MRLALPYMKGQPGAAVFNIASISRWMPQLAMSGRYGAAKATLIFAIERWALEFIAARHPGQPDPGERLGSLPDRQLRALRRLHEARLSHAPSGLGRGSHERDRVRRFAARWIDGRHVLVDGLEQPYAPRDRRPFYGELRARLRSTAF
jgi:NAD(P)-dependent dehydrogenase (short-subunit alcohol dehydrogenase family)